MKLRMSHLTIAVIALLLLHTHAQDMNFSDDFRPNTPLPRPNQTLVRQFKLALEAVFGMGIRLQAILQEDKDENFLVSPISAAVVIGQLILGANGVFRKQLVDLLSLPDVQNYENNSVQLYGKVNVSYDLPYSMLHIQLSNLLKSLESFSATKNFILTEKSAAFISNKLSMKDQFLRLMDSFYEARAYHVDFTKRSALRHINSWARKQTNGLIENLLPQPPSPQTQAIFANAVYFKAEWEYPFADILNRNGSFSVSQNKQVPVTYMISTLEDILYTESVNYDMIALPYKNEELGFYIMLPKPDSPYKYDMKNFIRNIKTSETVEAIRKAKRRDVIVKLPKMTVTNTFSILGELKKYQSYRNQHADKVNITNENVYDTLQDKVEIFTNFTTNTSKDIFLTNAAEQLLRVDDIVQQVVVTVNEKGTEAAAVSASTIDYIGGQKNFMVDRPFVFFIQHEATTATLFWGSISNPTA